MPAHAHPHSELVLSYLGLRKAVGCIGLALPVVLLVGHGWLDSSELPPSISDYYYSTMRDVLVGAMWALAVFMASYRGHERQDDITGDITCLSAIGVSLFPVAPADGATPLQESIGLLHLTFAGIFFISLAWFCLVIFCKGGANRSRRKQQRDRVFLVCGWTLIGCLLLLILFGLKSDDWPFVSQYKLVFWVEAIGIWAFGWSWLVKGQGLLADRPGS